MHVCSCTCVCVCVFCSEAAAAAAGQEQKRAPAAPPRRRLAPLKHIQPAASFFLSLFLSLFLSPAELNGAEAPKERENKSVPNVCVYYRRYVSFSPVAASVAAAAAAAAARAKVVWLGFRRIHSLTHSLILPSLYLRRALAWLGLAWLGLDSVVRCCCCCCCCRRVCRRALLLLRRRCFIPRYDEGRERPRERERERERDDDDDLTYFTCSNSW